MPTLYVETSIVSYLRQQPSVRVITAARQLLTHQWWNQERSKYELVTPQYVIDEASDGKPSLADVLHDLAVPIPVICTPEELVDDDEAE